MGFEMGIVGSSMKEICNSFIGYMGLILNHLRKQNMEEAEVGFINFKNAGLVTANVGLKIFNDGSLNADSMNSNSFKQNDLKVSSASDIIKDGDKDAAAIKVQKVYRSYRTRRNFADWAVLSNVLWWHTIESLRLKQSSFYDISKPESAISRWLRTRLRVAKVGKGLNKDEHARELAIQHWLEAIDPRHRYGRNLHIYYNEWFNRDTAQPFFHWLDIGDGRDLNLHKCSRSTLKKELIKYLGPKERENYEVVPQNGKLVYKQSRQLLDTTEGSDTTEGCEEPRWIFVMSTSKKLYVAKKKRGTFQHSSFLAGGATSAAGKLTVQDGVLKAICPHSGHYRPTEENLLEFLHFLEENGVDITDVEKGSFSEEDSSNGVTKQESKREEIEPIETLEANVLQETQSNSMDMDKNNSGVTNTETEKEENQPTDTLKANIPHEAHIESNTLDEDKNNDIAPLHDGEQNGSDVKSGMSPLLLQLGSTEGTESTSGGGKEKEDSVQYYKRSLSGELEIQRPEIPRTKLLQRLNSKMAIQSYQLGKQLSLKWSSGVGPRIGCVADYPPELRVKSLELVSPRCTSPSTFEFPKSKSPSGVPSPRCKSPSGNLTPRSKPPSN